MLLRNATLTDGSTVDVSIRGDLVVAVDRVRATDSVEGENAHDLAGYLLLGAPAEPHAHLDKALTADRIPNPSGDLIGAITAWRAYADNITVDDIQKRAIEAATDALAFGATAIRSHADLGDHIGLRAVEGVLAAKEALRGLVDIQVVALVAPPPPGVDRTRFPLLDQAIDMGVDLVGGAPWLDEHPRSAVKTLLDIAAINGLAVDFHLDETLDSDARSLDDLIEFVEAQRFEFGVTASHCVSLGTQSADRQGEVARAVADAGISIVTLPLTNLFLQGRDTTTSTPRGLTAVRALLDAGANLAAGADNVRDPFNTMGNGDPLASAALLVVAGHLTPDEAYAAVSVGTRTALGLPHAAPEIGAQADLVAVRAATLSEALAMAPADRIVIRGERIVARTIVDRWVADG